MTRAPHIRRPTTWRGALYALAVVGLAWATSCRDEEPPTAPPTPNRPPAPQGIIPAQVIKPGETTTVDAAAYFTDPDGQPLTFSSSTSDATVATVSVLGSTVTVLAERPGDADVTVTARDPAGLAAEQDFTVTVEPFSDREILILFHHATGGPNWFGSEDWLTDSPLGDWLGVEVDDEGKVVRLELYRNNLVGPIPTILAELTTLAHLELASNHLTGPIPPELGALTNLSHLGLFNNDLEGPVPPELGNLSNLTRLEIDRNALTGVIPDSFLELDGLRHFYFSRTEGFCVPGTPAFVNWIEETTYLYEGSFCNQSDLQALESIHETAGGSDWNNASGWLDDAVVGRWHGVTADSLGRVTGLDLGGNGLIGRLPQTVGRLALLTSLRMEGNALSGRLPESLSSLSLREFRYSDTELCAPPDSVFQSWLNAIPDHQGTDAECAFPSDRDILVTLYDATDGADWAENEHWLTDAPLGEWYGVENDAQGRVTALRLHNNALAGPIPPELGQLSELRDLVLWNNDLTGPIPPELGQLANLKNLSLWYAHLEGPIPPELGRLGELQDLGLGFNDLTGDIPRELAGLASLTSLALIGNALTGPIPPEFGDLAKLRNLWLEDNELTGPVPAQLGNLSNLAQLSLGANGLSGPIPAELGNLVALRNLSLADNDLTGPIPGALSGLVDLAWLSLGGNNLTGSIPVELGGLPQLRHLELSANNLTGSIPPELANGALSHLGLSNNRLTGPIPAQLGQLSTLRDLLLDHNRLTGPVPPELGRIPRLRRLVLTNNPDMTGALSDSLTVLERVTTLAAGGTGLCAPADAAFLQWLEGIPKRRIARCAEGGPATAYLTQAVQSLKHPVPLVAGRTAFLRVFVTATGATAEGIPAVRARFFQGGVETHVVDIPGKSTPIPVEIDEGDLDMSANVEIPGEVVQPGLEMMIDVDPEGTLDRALGVARRIPDEGRLAVDVRLMPLLELTLIPFLLEQAPDSTILDLVRDMAEDPEGHEKLSDTRALLPIGDFQVKVHEPVTISTNDAFTLFSETQAIRALEEGSGYYMGTILGRTENARGLGSLPGRVSFSKPEKRIIAHELGHNLNLAHAPCGGAGGLDRSFPTADGSIGAWGYDVDRGKLVRPGTPDMMSYCEPNWISDYYFANTVRFRLAEEERSRAVVLGSTDRAILLWGGTDAEGEPFLEPAFVLDAPASLPRPGSDYEMAGRDAGGRELFSLRFDMPEVPDGEGRSSFAFALPVQPEWAGTLASITLSEPGGSDTLNRETVRPMAIVRDPGNGQVRAILRGLPPATQIARDAVGRSLEPGLEVVLSLGIPGAEAWRR